MERSKPNSPILTYVRKLLEDGIKKIDNHECDEAELYSTLNRFNAEHQGYVDNASLVNYDEAMEILGVRNRNRVKLLCEMSRIEQVKIKNMRVGFRRSEIEDLACRLRNNNKNGG